MHSLSIRARRTLFFSHGIPEWKTQSVYFRVYDKPPIEERCILEWRNLESIRFLLERFRSICASFERWIFVYSQFTNVPTNRANGNPANECRRFAKSSNLLRKFEENYAITERNPKFAKSETNTRDDLSNGFRRKTTNSPDDIRIDPVLCHGIIAGTNLKAEDERAFSNAA